MTYRFGSFELSDEDFSLSRNGERLLLEPRALRLLLVLAASPGKLLDKKVLLDAVWTNTFVEETTLTRAIAVIRRQLDDDPRAPTYIQTVPTRGYRFIAPVSVQQAIKPLPEAVLEADSPSPLAPPPAAAAEASPTSVPAAAPPAQHRRVMFTAVPVAAVAVLLVFFLGRSSREASTLNQADTLVLAGFTNTSGDPVFDDALRQGLVVQLEQSPLLHLAGEEQVQHALRLMGRHPDDALSPQLSREICQRIGGTAVLDGSIARLGSAYVIGLRARRCSTGEELDTEQVQIARKEDALHALEEIATRFRRRIGEAGNSIHEHNAPLADATTASLDALKAFSLGIRNFNAKGSSAALPLFQHAVDVDPDFAVAHVWLGRMYADLGEEDLAIRSTTRAHDLRDRASDRERFTIDVSYDLLVTGDLEKARAACDAWKDLYPRDVYPRSFLSAMVYPAYGQYEKALAEARQSISIDPDFVVGYRNAAMNLIALQRPDDAEAVLKQAADRKVFLPSFVTDAYRIAFLKRDTPHMQEALAAAPRNPWLLTFQSNTLAQAGRLTESETIHEEALRLVRQGSRPETEAQLLLVPAFTSALYGKPREATAQAHAALRLSTSRDVEASAALVLALSAPAIPGSAAEALALASDLQMRYPDDTLLRYNRLPTIQAAIALAQNDPRRALKMLELTAQFGTSVPLYPAYLSGQALLALNQPEAAIAEFRKITGNPGLVWNDPLLNLAEMQLARAHLKRGNTAGARTSFASVQQRWSAADDFPAHQQLQREAAHLSPTS